MSGDLHLPSGTLHSRAIVDRCEWRIRHFVEHDAYVPYDYWITTRGLPEDVVTRDHLYAINNAMRAHARSEPWEMLLGQPVPELSAIAPDLDLVSSSDQDVERGLLALLAVCERIASHPWVTDMAVSKVFHLLRPRFVPISDSYVRLCLGIPDVELNGKVDRGAFYAARLARVARGIRELGRCNREALDRLVAFTNDLPPLVPSRGPFRGRQIPVRLTNVRTLDILLWAEVAIYGHTPHPDWLAAQHEAFGEPPRQRVRESTPYGSGATHGDVTGRQNWGSELPHVHGVAVFRDDDPGYLEWLRRHSHGMVLNCERSPRPGYLVLHRATCWTINGRSARGKSWTGPYLKACATTEAALREWADLATGGAGQACKLCRA